ncbi:neurobeachin-like protein 1 [Sycon ciliatum]|uniref:neurobeachin-like protein 1 n=1 Tax=Sycon ciliatum TaxID=27933 RepID=UPI0031F6D4F6
MAQGRVEPNLSACAAEGPAAFASAVCLGYAHVFSISSPHYKTASDDEQERHLSDLRELSFSRYPSTLPEELEKYFSDLNQEFVRFDWQSGADVALLDQLLIFTSCLEILARSTHNVTVLGKTSFCQNVTSVGFVALEQLTTEPSEELWQVKLAAIVRSCVSFFRCTLDPNCHWLWKLKSSVRRSRDATSCSFTPAASSFLTEGLRKFCPGCPGIGASSVATTATDDATDNAENATATGGGDGGEEDDGLPSAHQLEFLTVFIHFLGAALYASQENATIAISPPLADTIASVLALPIAAAPPNASTPAAAAESSSPSAATMAAATVAVAAVAVVAAPAAAATAAAAFIAAPGAMMSAFAAAPAAVASLVSAAPATSAAAGAAAAAAVAMGTSGQSPDASVSQPFPAAAAPVVPPPAPPSLQSRSLDVHLMARQCFVKCVHVIHAASPDQRQVDVSVLLSSLLAVLTTRALSLGEAHRMRLQTSLLECVPNILACQDAAALQAIFSSVGFFKELSLLFTYQGYQLGEKAVRVAFCRSLVLALASVMAGSPAAKEAFAEKFGYDLLMHHLKSTCPPCRALLQPIIEMAAERGLTDVSGPLVLRNVAPVVLLLKWMPDLPGSLQVWLSAAISVLCRSSLLSRNVACTGSLMTSLLTVLTQFEHLHTDAAAYILDLVEYLGMYSISSPQLRQLIGLFRPIQNQQPPYTTRLMQALEGMAHKSGLQGALHYFDLCHAEAGIDMPSLRRWPSSRTSRFFFTFHAWVSVDNMWEACNTSHPTALSQPTNRRKQLYSFYNSSDTGFEAFFNVRGVLVVAVCTKMGFFTVAVEGRPIVDSQWHCVDIVHQSTSRLSSKGQLTVYIDGKVCKTAELKCPSITEKSWSSCHIGRGGKQTIPAYLPNVRYTASPTSSLTGMETPETPTNMFMNETEAPLTTQQHDVMDPNDLLMSNEQHPSSVSAGVQDAHWGTPTSLHGQLASVCVFNEALTEEKVQQLHAKGPNYLQLFQKGDSDINLFSLSTNLLFYYHAKACHMHTVEDLKPCPDASKLLHGRLTGQVCVTWDIKKVLDCVGGIQVLIVLLELNQLDVLPYGSALHSDMATSACGASARATVATPTMSSNRKPGGRSSVMSNTSLCGTAVEDDPMFQAAQSLPALPGVGNSTSGLAEAANQAQASRSVHATGASIAEMLISSSNQVDCEDSVDDMFEIVSTPSEDVPDSLFELQARKPRSWSRGNQLPPSQQQQQQERRKGKLWRAPYQHILFESSEVVHGDNAVSSFLGLLRSVLRDSEQNQDAMVKFGGMPTVGALMIKAKPEDMDVSVLMAVQSLVESVHKHSSLLSQLYQHLLFDFRLWMNSQNHVRIGHIQYLTTVIKDNCEVCRNDYGVQFMLDTARVYFSPASTAMAPASASASGSPMLRACQPTPEESKAIRSSLLGIVRFYVQRRIRSDEVRAIICYISACSLSEQILEVLDMLHALLTKAPNKESQEHLANQFAKPGAGQLLLTLLQRDEEELLISTCKVLSLLLREPTVSASHKAQLLLQEASFVAVLDSQLVSEAFSIDVLYAFLGLSLNGDEVIQYGDVLLSVMSLVALSPLESRLSIAKHVYQVLSKSPDSASEITKQPCWFRPLFALLYTPRAATKKKKPPRHSEDTEDDDDAEQEEEESKLGGGGGGEDATTGVGKANSDLQPDIAGGAVPVPTDLSEITGAAATSSKSRDGDSDVQATTSSLVETVVRLLHMLSEYGLPQFQENSWLERGQLFAALENLCTEKNMLASHVLLKRRLLQLALQCMVQEVNKSGLSNAVRMESARQLLELLETLLFDARTESAPIMPQEFETEQLLTVDILDNSHRLADVFCVWESGATGSAIQIRRIVLRLLLAYAVQVQQDLCAAAVSRLQPVLRNNVFPPDVVGHVLNKLDEAMTTSVSDGREKFNYFLLPILHVVMQQHGDTLQIRTALPNLPDPTRSSNFQTEFLEYRTSSAWKDWVQNDLSTISQAYLRVPFKSGAMKSGEFWMNCCKQWQRSELLMQQMQAESSDLVNKACQDPFYSCRLSERERHRVTEEKQVNQLLSTLHQWQATKRLFTGERDPWSTGMSENVFWKLDRAENFSRMHMKLVRDFTGNQHTDASMARDQADIIASSGNPAGMASQLRVKKEARVRNLQGDRLGDEEWSLLTAAMSSKNTEGEQVDVVVQREQCTMITLMHTVIGEIRITNKHIYFFDSRPQTQRDEGSGGDFVWSLNQLREIHLRRYNLRRSALELFFIDQTNHFLNFENTKVRDQIYRFIFSLKPPNVIYNQARSPAELLRQSGLTKKWVHRKISNFDYLMQLNTIAGRTYNDLSQYPVFPWILQDYTSEKLDLEDPNTFRPLHRPMGVVNPERIEEVQTKYEGFEDPSGVIDKFHYGTHYSNAAGVLHFLLRLEPYTTLHIQLQSGKFDVSDRQFFSIPSSWDTLMKNPNDVKELIPEFYYLPEFLNNVNSFDLGHLQTGNAVNNVELPPWAESAEDFIRKHREALESDYVSDHLHEWIDLIFGYKQRGEAAVDALNIFFYCTYEGAVDLDAITDEHERRVTESMINNFGQTPSQLFQEPHPSRLSHEASSRINTQQEARAMAAKMPSIFTNFRSLKASFVEINDGNDQVILLAIPPQQSHSFIHHGMPDTLISISRSGLLGLHGWLPHSTSKQQSFTFNFDPTLVSKSTRQSLSHSFAPGLLLSANLFAYSPDGRLLLTAGHWDNSIHVVSVVRGRPRTTTPIYHHYDLVTCLCVDSAGVYVIAGSRDTSCTIWKIVMQAGSASHLESRPTQTLFGHDAAVTSVAISVELDIALSGSQDGTVIIHTIRQGIYVRTLAPGQELASRSLSTPCYRSQSGTPYGGARTSSDGAAASSTRSDDGRCSSNTAAVTSSASPLTRGSSKKPTSRQVSADVFSSVRSTAGMSSMSADTFSITSDMTMVSYLNTSPSGKRTEDLVVSHLLVADNGHVVMVMANHTSGQVKHEMFTYTLNGVCICSATLGKKLGAIACYEDFVLVAEGSRVRIRSLTSLAVIHELTTNAPIDCLHIAPDGTHLLLGLRDGKMVVYSLPG